MSFRVHRLTRYPAVCNTKSGTPLLASVARTDFIDEYRAWRRRKFVWGFARMSFPMKNEHDTAKKSWVSTLPLGVPTTGRRFKYYNTWR